MNFSSPEFIQKLKERDHAAMLALINQYHENLFLGALRQKLAPDQAEEVVQQTWTTFFEKVEKFQGRSHIRTYLFGIMYNKIKELWRSNKKYTQVSDENIDQQFDEHGGFQSIPKDPSAWTESQEFLSVLESELDKLPEKQRMAFYLKEIQGESSKSICNILDISNTNLGVLLYRAKNTLRLRLEKRFSYE